MPYFLPKTAQKLIISYTNGEIAISTICPEHTAEVNVAFIMDSGNTYHNRTTIHVPELCLTHTLSKGKFLLNAHKDGKFSKYIMANVYDYGVICFGDVIHKVPEDLRQAWNYYWASSFNQENSSYDDFHQDRCLGVKVHSFAGHQQTSKCICACCIEICNCDCYCSQVKVFNDYLKEFSKRERQFLTNDVVLNKASYCTDVASNKLLILPASMKETLGLSKYKYPDIFAFVTSEDATEYRCLVDSTEISILKTWVDHGKQHIDANNVIDTNAP